MSNKIRARCGFKLQSETLNQSIEFVKGVRLVDAILDTLRSCATESERLEVKERLIEIERNARSSR